MTLEDYIFDCFEDELWDGTDVLNINSNEKYRLQVRFEPMSSGFQT